MNPPSNRELTIARMKELGFVCSATTAMAVADALVTAESTALHWMTFIICPWLLDQRFIHLGRWK